MFTKLQFLLFFFFNDTATTEIYTLCLHDALPISPRGRVDIPEQRPIDSPRDEAMRGSARRGMAGPRVGSPGGLRAGSRPRATPAERPPDHRRRSVVPDR